MYSLQDITILIANYRTPDLIQRCVKSCRLIYPAVKLLLVDNGSQDESTVYITELAHADPLVDCLLNLNNHYHGPALDQGLRAAKGPLALILDSDTEFQKPGLLESMSARFTDDKQYAVGQLVYLDYFGYETYPTAPLAFPYIHPWCMLLERQKYFSLPPFIHHGSPGIRNMRKSGRIGFSLVDFPVSEYVKHKGRGTCGQYGYGLGKRHVIEYLLHSMLARFYPKNLS